MNEVVIKVDRVIEGDFKPFAIELKGKKHYIKEATIRDYIANEKALKELQSANAVEREIEILMDMVCRAFPTVTFDDLSDLTPSQLVAFVNDMRVLSGEATHADEKSVEVDPASGK